MTASYKVLIKWIVIICLLCTSSALVAYTLKPRLAVPSLPADFEQSVPKKINDWIEQPSPYLQVGLVANDDKSSDQPYDRVLMRSYKNASGDQVMLALAYAQEQTQDIKIHRPEVCYQAQGFTLQAKKNHDFVMRDDGAVRNIPLVRLLVESSGRLEAVSYWIRVGNAYPVSPLSMRMQILRDGLKGVVDDGILVRASMIIDDPAAAAAAYSKQEAFLQQLVQSMNPDDRTVLVQ